MEAMLADDFGAAAMPIVPSGEEIFGDAPVYTVQSSAERYSRKPTGTSDQGYRED
jgi:hypothetical protein